MDIANNALCYHICVCAVVAIVTVVSGRMKMSTAANAKTPCNNGRTPTHLYHTHTNTYIDVVRCVNAPARILSTPSRRHHHYHHLLAIRNACLWSPLDVYYLRFILLLSAFLYCEVRPFLCIRWQLQ